MKGEGPYEMVGEAKRSDRIHFIGCQKASRCLKYSSGIKNDWFEMHGITFEKKQGELWRREGKEKREKEFKNA